MVINVVAAASLSEMERKLQDSISKAVSLKSRDPYISVTGEYYNKVPKAAIDAINAAKRCDIDNTLNGIVDMWLGFKDYVWMTPDHALDVAIYENFSDMVDTTMEMCSELMKRCTIRKK